MKVDRRVVVQAAGFALGLALLGWCVHVALRPENRGALENLRQAPGELVAAMIGLSLTTLFLNATTFWTAIFPVKRLPFWEVQATNAGAALCNYAPFKLGAVLRFVVHSRRHGVPLITIAAWIAAVTLTMTVALTPLIAAGMWRKQADALFWVGLLVGTAATYAVALAVARVFAHAQGLARLHRMSDRPGLRWLLRLMRTRAFLHLHAGFAMMAHPGSFGLGVAMRVLDLLVQAARFMVAARLVGMDLTFEGALIVSGAYFLVSVVSPAGSLGVREYIASRLALFGMSMDSLTVVALTVTASEMVVYMVCGTAGLLYLRPGRGTGAAAAEGGAGGGGGGVGDVGG